MGDEVVLTMVSANVFYHYVNKNQGQTFTYTCYLWIYVIPTPAIQNWQHIDLTTLPN